MSVPVAAAALTAGYLSPVGSYTYRRATDRWWWSDEVYRIHGFQPGEVVPTTALLMAHKHPRDLARIEHVIAVELPVTGKYCVRHHIIDAQQNVRTLVAVGQRDVDPETDQDIGLSGYFIDLTESERLHAADAVAEAMNESIGHREAIEQAKGILLGVLGMDPAAGFALLSTRSQLLNVKVRDLAAQLVRRFVDQGCQDDGCRRALIASVLKTEWPGGVG